MENNSEAFRKDKFSSYGKLKNYDKVEIREDVIQDLEINYLRFLKDFKDKKILDLGCGQGYFLDFLKKHNFSDYIGIDIDEDLAEVCKRKGHNAISGDGFDFLKKTKYKFDVIVLNDVFEHFKKEEGLALLKLINNKMNKNGIIIIRVPNANFMFSCSARYADYTHEILYEKESLTQVLNLSGFDTIYVGDYNYGIIGGGRSIKNIIVKSIRKIILIIHNITLRIVAGRKYNECDIFAVARKKNGLKK